MASGIGERPLPNLENERNLLGISGVQALKAQVGASKIATFTFPNGVAQDGLIIMSAGASTLTKRGLYIYGCSSSGNIAVTEILKPTQTNMSVTGSGRTIVIANGTSDLFVCILSFQGSLPTVTQT